MWRKFRRAENHANNRRLTQAPAEVANALGERAYMFSKAALVSGEGVLMTPRRTDTDGFFVSLLRRSA